MKTLAKIGRHVSGSAGAWSRPGRARALVRYFRDPAASVFGKLFVLAAVVYVICPIDLIPDVPIVGWLDDIGVMSLAVAWMWKVVGRYRAPESGFGETPALAAV